VELSVFRVDGPGEIISAVDAAKASGAEALNFPASPLFSVPGSQSNRVVLDRVTAARLPAIFQFPETAEAGAFAGYGPRLTDLYRQRARIAVQVLRGAKPADIPVQQPDKFEMVINLKTAKAIGVEVPATLVARADKLIDERT
jgi:putative ABC transport system substrate-binding protein